MITTSHHSLSFPQLWVSHKPATNNLLTIITATVATCVKFFSCCSAGPGPGRYRLPACVGHSGHDPTKKTMPAYSFGKRLENSSELVCVCVCECVCVCVCV